MEFTKESLMTDSILEAACEQLDPENMDIKLDRTGQTIETLVLDYFFDKIGDEYSLKQKFMEEYLEFIRDEDSSPSDALYNTIMTHDTEFSDALAQQYKYGVYTEDPEELDEMADDYLLEKRLAED